MPDINALLNPRTVAVVGASNDNTILRGRTLEVLLSHPYQGKVYPVSRSAAEVQGLKAYKSVGEIPDKIDLALLIIPAKFVPDELERCGEAGVKAAQIITAGFSDGGGDEGEAAQAKIIEMAQKYDMAIGGPNSEGFANLSSALCTTFSPAVAETTFPLIPEYRTDGFVAAIAQSGGSGFGFYDQGRPKELPFNYVVTTGNEAALETFQFVDFLIDEGRTDAFLLFLEDVKSPDIFQRVAEKALRAGKPIILTKIGKSEAGRRAAASHTGAMTGSYDAYQAMFRKYGIIEGKDREEMCDIAAGFSQYGSRLPLGKRVGICTGSGGSGGWMAESCSAAGLEVPILDDATRAQIDAHLPHYATSQNPVDGTAGSIRKIGYSVLGEWVAASPEVDTVIIVSSARNAKVFEAEKETMTRVARETLKPIVMCSYTMPGAAATRIINEAGFPLFMNMPNCARTVREMADYRTLRESFVKVPEINTRNTSREKATRDALHLHTQGNGALCEVEAADIFTAYDIDFGPGGLAATPEEAVSIASGIGGPVALKIQSPDILHKTDAGGVALNVEGEANIKTAFADILSNGKKFKPDADIRGVLIRPMARSGVEMILGIKNDELFGPMLMVGLGGIFVEVLKDVVLLPVPLSQEDALAALRRLKGAAILNGVRGQKPADVDALAALMVRLSQFAVETSGDVAEAELNPVLIHPAGEGVSVVDALIVKT
jgi:acetyltransferase